jgi:hypothetical protein
MNRNGTCKHHMIFKNDLKKLLVYSDTAMVSELLLEWKQFSIVYLKLKMLSILLIFHHLCSRKNDYSQVATFGSSKTKLLKMNIFLTVGKNSKYAN